MNCRSVLAPIGWIWPLLYGGSDLIEIIFAKPGFGSGKDRLAL
jgi:hypothetical protein